MSNHVEEFLAHYGVAGMKWHQRKTIDDVAKTVDGVDKAGASAVNILTKGDYTKNPVFSEDSKTTDRLFTVRESIQKFLSKKNLSSLQMQTTKRVSNFISGIRSK